MSVFETFAYVKKKELLEGKFKEKVKKLADNKAVNLTEETARQMAEGKRRRNSRYR